MSASATASVGLHSEPSTRGQDPAKFRAFAATIVFAGLATLVVVLTGRTSELQHNALPLLLWLAALAVVDLLPISYSLHVWTMSVAVLLAAGMIYSPGIAGLLAFFGSIDRREFRREMNLRRSLFNRSQIALASMAASAVFHSVAGGPTVWPVAIPAALAAVAADALINLMLVSVAAGLLQENSYKAALPYFFQRVLWPSRGEYLFNYVCLGLLGLLFAAAYAFIGPWGFVASLTQVLVVRRAFLYRNRSAVAESEVARTAELLETTGDRVEREKCEERQRLAADLHDEVLPALFKVHLMGEVLKQDVDWGRLLDLDEDLPQLLDATDYAAAKMRALIATLRRSTVHPGGVTPTLALLVADMSRDTPAEIKLRVEDVGASPLTQLLLFQIAREAIRNAIKHAEARRIDVVVARDGLHAVLSISDDGKGFSLEGVDLTDHFGLDLMTNRARMAGGHLEVKTGEGAGTVVSVRVPLDAPIT